MASETPPTEEHTTSLPGPEDEPTNTGGANTAPALNRAERRAQAKGKKLGPTGATGAPSAAPRAPGGKGHVGQVRFPRTGNK